MTALSELLAKANVQGWSSREIARRAEKTEHKLSYASAAVYLGGRHGEPTEAVLAAFSDVLNIPIDKLREAAGVPTGADSPWTPPSEANRLDLRQRRALEELIRSMVTSETLGEDHTDDDQDTAGMERDAQPDGVKPDLAPDDTNPGGSGAREIEDPRHRRSDNAAAEPTKADFTRAAMAGHSDLELDDASAEQRGEESQDPGNGDPA